MASLIDLEVVKKRLGVIGTKHDDNLSGLIVAASSMVLDYLKVEEAFYDSNNPVPPHVAEATGYLVGILFRDRDGVEAASWDANYLPRPVVAMLYTRRDPAVS